MLGPMTLLDQLGWIVPIGRDEEQWPCLLEDLFTHLPQGSVLFFCAEAPETIEAHEVFRRARSRLNLQLLGPAEGRAQLMNLGARHSQKSFLIFIHADSRLDSQFFEGLLKLKEESLQDCLGHFRLRFRSRGFSRVKFNEWGAHLRSRFFKMPFGDQGFLIGAEVFKKIGGFDESASYGEDHLLVWKARQQGVRIRGFPLSVSSSARKYRQRGWLSVTGLHWRLTLKQALPEAKKLLLQRLRTTVGRQRR